MISRAGVNWVEIQIWVKKNVAQADGAKNQTNHRVTEDTEKETQRRSSVLLSLCPLCLCGSLIFLGAEIEVDQIPHEADAQRDTIGQPVPIGPALLRSLGRVLRPGDGQDFEVHEDFFEIAQVLVKLSADQHHDQT